MGLFVSTYVNKVDRKGRVSVPASFRAALGQQSFNGILAYPSLKSRAIEACGSDFMERLNQGVESAFEMFSETHSDLSTVIFASTQPLAFDAEGRVVLPGDLAEHAGITEQAAFVGTGRSFQIWEPEAFRRHLAEARERALSKGATLPVRPVAPGGTAP